MRHHTHQHHWVRGPHGHGHNRGGRGSRGPGRRRARRGAVAAAVLALLDEEPRHGYDLIAALDERSGGRWTPGPGSIYPALHGLEERGLISSTEVDGKQVYELTMDGRRRLAEQREAGMDTPWDDHGLGQRGDLRHAIAELAGAARQVGRFGNSDRVAEVIERISATTADIYRILGQPAETDRPSEPTDDD